MMLELSVAAATGYGLSDFAGGLAARRAPVAACLRQTQTVGLAILLIALPLAPGHLTAGGVGWAAAAGLAGLLGCALLYRLMRTHPLSSVAPLTALLAALTPVVVGAICGEHLAGTAVAGIAAGLSAVALIGGPAGSGRRLGSGGGLTANAMAVAAGAGFGGFFVLIAKAGGPEAGIGPLLVARTVALVVVVAVAPWARRSRSSRQGRLTPSNPGVPLSRVSSRWAAVAGTTDAVADLCYLGAARSGLALAGLVTSLYPAVTVACAMLVLGEHLDRRSAAGLVLSAAAVALIAS